MEDLIDLLSEIKIKENGKRKLTAGSKLPLTLMSFPVLQKYIKLSEVDHYIHISCVTPDRVWIRYNNDLVLTDIRTGVKLHCVDYPLNYYSQTHTVNRKGELIYLDKNDNIIHLSNDMKTTTTLIKHTDTTWRPCCIYSSPSSGDLLVGMHMIDRGTGLDKGKVMRYNNTGQHAQTIPHSNNITHRLYTWPNYLTENNNGDVVVCDLLDSGHSAVTVTSKEGVHRFSYHGPRSRSGLWEPQPPFSDTYLRLLGICTDALSNILVSDLTTQTIHMLSQDGHFLKYLLVYRLPGSFFRPHSLSYDVHTHCLWVGLSHQRNMLHVYRHISRHPAVLQ